MRIDFRQCKYFFLPLNPKCTTTTSTTTTIVPHTTTTTTTTTPHTTTSTTTSTTSTTTTTCACYTGYEVTPDGKRCVKTLTTPATPPTEQEIAVAKSYENYSVNGSILFNPGYNSNGTTSNGYQILSTPFWKNVGYTNTDGPMNRCALWATTFASNQDVGFTHCITVEEEKTYYIGIGCDNYAIIRVDGNTIIHQDVAALNAQFGAGTSVTFKFWFIYPVQLSAGFHVIELIGHNNESIAALGAEIYDATKDEIIAATNYTDFYNSYILFTTKDMVGQNIQIGTDGYGWTCPDGYSLVICQGPPYCTNISYLDCGEIPPH